MDDHKNEHEDLSAYFRSVDAEREAVFWLHTGQSLGATFTAVRHIAQKVLAGSFRKRRPVLHASGGVTNDEEGRQ